MDVAILRGCGKPEILTHLMYKTKVDCSCLKKRVLTLAAKGLLENHSKPPKHHMHNLSNPIPQCGKVYSLTEKGREFLKALDEAMLLYHGRKEACDYVKR
jgi:predicted transcriptional regulator